MDAATLASKKFEIVLFEKVLPMRIVHYRVLPIKCMFIEYVYKINVHSGAM